MRKSEIRILKISIFTATAVVIALICLFSYLHYKKYHYVDRGMVIAKINNKKIYEKDIETRMLVLAKGVGKKNLKMKELDEETLKALLLEGYVNKLFLKLAKKDKKIFDDNNHKFSAKEYHEGLIRRDYMAKYIFNSINEGEIKKKYEILIGTIKHKEERKISHILVETKEEADRVKNLILRRNNFEQMARQRSLDKASAANGGSLGYVMMEELTIPEFTSIAFLLKTGELSKPIQTKEGWHIIKVDDVRNVKTKSYNDSRDEILRSLEKEKFDNFLLNLLKDVKIEIVGDNGKIIRLLE
ncbi:MAG: peptidylprolyl isomerase [Rickettsiales bacterium]|jgi:parvulin-like peptidyl-prolyl isomerase|nr:peptidylprolyl isomerase [Rickettsiales bacterium]